MIHGKTRANKKYYCKDCGRKISLHSGVYGLGRCSSCNAKTRQGKTSPNYKDGITLKEYFCIECNSPITYAAALYGKGRCKLCNNINQLGTHSSPQTEFKKGDNRGKNHYLWCGGPSGYPYEFSLELKEKIRSRDNHICQYCGINEEKCILTFHRKLAVHHIDYNKENCLPENLITLCSYCHILTNANRDFWYSYFRYLIENMIFKR